MTEKKKRRIEVMRSAGESHKEISDELHTNLAGSLLYESGHFSSTEPCRQDFVLYKRVKKMDQTNDLTFGESRANMVMGDPLMNLENKICAFPTVQADREYTSSPFAWRKGIVLHPIKFG